jgi:hypothetical protein
MATIELNVDGCDIAHETLRLEEYGGDVMRAGWRQQFTLVGGSPVAQIRRRPIDHGSSAIPHAAPEEAVDDFGLVLSSLFPQCP